MANKPLTLEEALKKAAKNKKPNNNQPNKQGDK